MPPSHRYYAEWNPARFIQWAGKTGESTAKLVETILSTRPYPEQGYRACLGIIHLVRDYEPARIEAAASRALRYHALSYRSMKAILSAGLGPAARWHGTAATYRHCCHTRTSEDRILSIKGVKPLLNQQTISIMHLLKLKEWRRALKRDWPTLISSPIHT